MNEKEIKQKILKKASDRLDEIRVILLSGIDQRKERSSPHAAEVVGDVFNEGLGMVVKLLREWAEIGDVTGGIEK